MAQLDTHLTPEQRKSIVGCGITNQRETTVLWRRSDGILRPSPGVARRTHGRPALMEGGASRTDWRRRTGLLLDPYFSASKIQRLLNHDAAAAAAAEHGDLCFGTVESWLLWKLTAGRHHCSDMSNASRTLLMDLEKRQWVDRFCEQIGLPHSALPELVPCCGDFGVIDTDLPFAGVPIRALLGDQQAATLGQLCLKPGEAKCTYGTGAFLVVNTGAELRRSDQGLLTTLGWTDANGVPTYCLEGSLFNAGTVVQWLRDGLGLIDNAAQINDLAQSVNSSGGVMLVPAFTGWGTPHWDPSARGLLIGLTRDGGHIARAALEGIALGRQLGAALGHSLGELAVDSGAAASNPLLSPSQQHRPAGEATHQPGEHRPGCGPAGRGASRSDQ